MEMEYLAVKEKNAGMDRHAQQEFRAIQPMMFWVDIPTLQHGGTALAPTVV